MKNKGVDDAFHITLKLAQRLFSGEEVTTYFIRKEFGVSVPTAKRYMTRLERSLPVVVENVPNGFTKHFGTSRKLMRLMRGPAVKVGRDLAMPECDHCSSSAQVERLGPDTFGSEFWCKGCDAYWAQST